MERKRTFYERRLKRPLDIFGALLFLLLFGWLLAAAALLVRFALGSPVIFRQMRPGKNERIFRLYKFRSMSNEKDEKGKLLPDENRLGRFGRWLRSSSLDELPEIFNILAGDMSFVGPRPQLVRDMVFMTEEQRRRHAVRPGLTGLAQISGRNGLDWDEKLRCDLRYIKKITFREDLYVLWQTFIKAVLRREGITAEGEATSPDLGDWLLAHRRIDAETYRFKQEEARRLLSGEE
ncbi:MAG: sugar transferase [Pyramidobacter sp.]|jgi:undecaprenyl phosphate N,N'-diacetylbacillosamine 1-phosphate transferase